MRCLSYTTTTRRRCDWRFRGSHAKATSRKWQPQPLIPRGFSSDALASASAALHIVLLRGSRASGGVALADDAVFRAVVGWPQRELPPGHPAASTDPSVAAGLLAAIVHMVRLPNVPLDAYGEAIRRWLVPGSKRASAESLRDIPEHAWHMAKELLLARMLHDRGLSAETVRRLTDLRCAPSRAEFASAFGQRLARPRRWEAPCEANPSRTVLEPRIRAAGGDVAVLTLEETLFVARPRLTAAWCSPLAYCVQNGIGHFAEALTSECVLELAKYLRDRRATLCAAASARGGSSSSSSSSPAIVECGAGSGRLTHLLNETGLLSPPIIATDPTPQPSPFRVQRMDDNESIRTHRPCLILCAWMSIGDDWTHRWRRQRVDEYVLIGELGGAPSRRARGGAAAGSLARSSGPACGGSPCYSLSECVDHAPYERVLLERVSSELLGTFAGREEGGGSGGVVGGEVVDDEADGRRRRGEAESPDSSSSSPSWSSPLCAVAFRRPAARAQQNHAL